MNHLHRKELFSIAARWLCGLLAALVLPVNVFAQPKGPQRWLLVFDLSSTMKSRLPATEAVLTNFFATSAEGRLQDGDDIAVWTYDQKMRGGQFPMAVWNPEQATELTTNLTGFLRSRTFTGDSRLAALQPALGSVVADSERLTILIFCAGESDISATPYDSGINQSFLDGREERRKNHQPFVVLIRSLSGKYIGCTVNFPPGAINIPRFLAPLPPTNLPPQVPVVAAVKPAPVVVPDLVIVGTHVGPITNTPQETAPPAAQPVPVVAPKIIAAPVMAAPVTNPPPAVVTISVVTNVVSAPPPVKVEVPVEVPATNTVAVSAVASPQRPIWQWVAGGVGLLVVIVIVAAILIFRPGRRPQTSLITSSMQDDPRRK
jgi:hypothetical protein